MRGNRLAALSNQVDRGAPPSPRHVVDYWCAADHKSAPVFAADVESPAEWPCHVCGSPAVMQRGAAPPAARPKIFPRTPYEFLMMRRTDEDGERILAEAIAAMRKGDYPRPGAGVRPRR
jgi:hypothetical protein